MTELQRVLVAGAIIGTGVVLLTMGGALMFDIIDHYRMKRIYELNRRNK